MLFFFFFFFILFLCAMLPRHRQAFFLSHIHIRAARELFFMNMWNPYFCLLLAWCFITAKYSCGFGSVSPHSSESFFFSPSLSCRTFLCLVITPASRQGKVLSYRRWKSLSVKCFSQNTCSCSSRYLQAETVTHCYQNSQNNLQTIKMVF